MHHKWIKWLKQAGDDSATESKIEYLRHQRKLLHIECLLHKHYLAQQEIVIAGIKSKLYTAQHEYEQLDLELAMIDGRFSVLASLYPEDKKQADAEKKKQKEIKNLIEETTSSICWTSRCSDRSSRCWGSGDRRIVWI